MNDPREAVSPVSGDGAEPSPHAGDVLPVMDETLTDELLSEVAGGISVDNLGFDSTQEPWKPNR